MGSCKKANTDPKEEKFNILVAHNNSISWVVGGTTSLKEGWEIEKGWMLFLKDDNGNCDKKDKRKKSFRGKIALAFVWNLRMK